MAVADLYFQQYAHGCVSQPQPPKSCLRNRYALRKKYLLWRKVCAVQPPQPHFKNAKKVRTLRPPQFSQSFIRNSVFQFYKN